MTISQRRQFRSPRHERAVSGGTAQRCQLSLSSFAALVLALATLALFLILALALALAAGLLVSARFASRLGSHSQRCLHVGFDFCSATTQDGLVRAPVSLILRFVLDRLSDSPWVAFH